MAYVRAYIDVYCSWQKRPPRYRIYVNNELFTERTWRWTDVYLEEMLQLELGPGEYKLKFELLDKKKAALEYKNLRIGNGPATVVDQETIRVTS